MVTTNDFKPTQFFKSFEKNICATIFDSLQCKAYISIDLLGYQDPVLGPLYILLFFEYIVAILSCCVFFNYYIMM